MDRFIVACLLILAILSAICIIDFAVEPYYAGTDDRAIRIALADPDVQATLASRQNNYTIVNLTSETETETETDKSGYINVSHTLAVVNISMYDGMFTRERFIVFVDLNRSRVTGSEWYAWRGFPSSLEITLPPGASYYHLLSGPINGGPGVDESFGVQTFWCSLEKLTPANATICPALVDEPNFRRMKNGSSYEAAAYKDTFTGLPAMMNGTAPVRSPWHINASIKRPPRYNTGSWPDFDFSQRYYIVLTNAGSDIVSMTIGM